MASRTRTTSQRISEDNPTVQCAEKTSATVQRLAPELLCEIFFHCVPDDTDSCRSIRIRSRGPLLLGRICQMWRIVSYSSPELWSRFAVGDDHSKNVEFEKDFKAMKHWISKSGSQPLSLLIYYPGHFTDGALLPPIFEILVSPSWRWKEITLTVPCDFEDTVLAPFRTGNLPQLVNFDSTTMRRRSREQGSPEFILSSAPQLQSLRHNGEGAD
ncbi:hypothetical protein BD410DRAFT_792508 [Rickenella mellea]|uniref:F-box domain-containing protein n=1 Tax=Rickenella mellea TaxID=50990 RepID=A0A4Y7PUJ1_9AGAM|nr:hypothetical protein BD410DRAFT_792508 [Rickenella mellea]